jgi:5-methylcytosine-specific restriction endonuclease McrA
VGDDLPFPKVPKRIYPETEERKHLSPVKKIGLIEKQGKKCACCGCSPTRFEFDHIQELALGGTNDDDNWQALCRNCHTAKTKLGASERKVMRKKRDLTSQWARRQRDKPAMKLNRDGSVKVNRT